MDAQQMIYMARSDTYTDASQIPDTDGLINGKPVLWMLTYLNFAYRDLISQITNQVNEDRYADIFTTNLNQGQIEYTMPTGNSSQSGLQNILGVSVNYTAPVACTGTVSIPQGSKTVTGVGTSFTTQLKAPAWINMNINIADSFYGTQVYRVVEIVSDTVVKVDRAALHASSGASFASHRQDWQTCYPKRFSMLAKDPDYYIQNQPYDSPMFIAYDTGCFIYPQPKADIIGGLKLFWTIDPIHLVLSPTPTTPIIDSTWHYVLPIAMKRYIFAAKGMLNEKNDAIAEYQVEFNKVIKATMERELMAVEKQMPLLTDLQ